MMKRFVTAYAMNDENISILFVLYWKLHLEIETGWGF